MFDRVQARFGPARRADLGVDVLDVGPDGLHREHESRRDLLVRQTARDELEDLDLAMRETVLPVAPTSNAMPRAREDSVDRGGVEAAGAHIGAQLASGVV